RIGGSNVGKRERDGPGVLVCGSRRVMDEEGLHGEHSDAGGPKGDAGTLLTLLKQPRYETRGLSGRREPGTEGEGSRTRHRWSLGRADFWGDVGEKPAPPRDR